MKTEITGNLNRRQFLSIMASVGGKLLMPDFDIFPNIETDRMYPVLTSLPILPPEYDVGLA